MNNNTYQQREIEIDLKELMWKLLSQWKAMLIVALIAAVLVPGLKFMKDKSAYDAALEEKKEAEKQAEMPAEKRIEEALAALPAQEADDVLYLVQQQDMVDEQIDYLENSIWLNTDPASQRKLVMTYYIKGDGSTDIRSLTDAYAIFVHKDDFVNAIREVIKKDAKKEYINELVDTNTANDIDSDAVGTNLTILITMTDDTDAAQLEEVVKDAVKGINRKLSSAYGDHSTRLLNSEDWSLYNQDVIDRRTNTNYTINNLKGNITNTKNSMTPEQQAAFEAITKIKAEAGAAGQKKVNKKDESEELEKAAFSKKYAGLGFILGLFLYAGAYVVMLILKGGVSSAASLQSYTASRLLGEVYYRKSAAGIRKLLQSDLVDRYHYKGRTDSEAQLTGIADSLAAVCSHAGTKDVTIFDMRASGDSEGAGLVSALKEKAEAKGLKTEVTDASKDVDEGGMLSVKDAVVVADSATRASALGNLMSLMSDYDIRTLGIVYISEM